MSYIPASIEWKDGVVVSTRTTFSWGDRLRILFGRPLHVHIKVDTENVVGLTRTTSDVVVEPLFRSAPSLGMVEVR